MSEESTTTNTPAEQTVESTTTYLSPQFGFTSSLPPARRNNILLNFSIFAIIFGLIIVIIVLGIAFANGTNIKLDTAIALCAFFAFGIYLIVICSKVIRDERKKPKAAK